ncbi:hypothetical protein LTR78_009834 [Recurvomyces mirabilis]|uniref:UBC core domain-containing protein n=1 Tax=Recurvomyces mirabilis TaxID=574656 RepID=A0AAE0TNW4_9PEZI|nr:hypothetical protein LTR78_009834 [Recurvomyces mirabilis]KAK5153070.1 hypothetical protein LTS14_007714 [Recurvomyces mirabilis]
MPRRQFINDLQKAQDNATPLPHGIFGLQQGDDDGQFEFEFLAPTDPAQEAVKITALIPDVSEYPKSHEYMIFCGDDAPRHIASALEIVRGTNRKTVFELLDIVSATLNRLSPDKDGDIGMPDSQADDLESEDEVDDDVYDSDHEAFEISAQHTTTVPTPNGKPRTTGRAFRTRIREDLRIAKSAGFKVGHLGHLLDGHNSFVTISIRMSKLGISDEAMQAWHIDPKDYLILIIQYPNGYKTNEELQSCDSLRLAPNLGMRLCASKKYKPTLQEAIKAFTTVKKSDRDSISSTDLPSAEAPVAEEDNLRDTFISKPLNGFFQERLVPLLRYRSAGLDWCGAENWFTEITNNGASGADAVPDKFYEPEKLHNSLPPVATADHYTARRVTQYSFPLLAMQFALRHFIRCTEFCLVCHRKLYSDIEAIKPYVCDQSLCLYQYMTLGFGPSIEHEIMTQPYVVDLLLSFCYSSANSKRLKDFPDGLAMMVPPIDLAIYSAGPDLASYGYRVGRQPPVVEKKVEPDALPTYEVGYDADRLELIFFNMPEHCPVRRGSWIVLKMQGTVDASEVHCRVADVTYYPTISIDPPLILPTTANFATAQTTTSKTTKTVTPATTPKWAQARFQIYEQDFEKLDKNGKCLSICKLLDTIPNVKDLQDYLAKNRPADLKFWVNRLSPAALSLLRWVIASNRACIMQVDGETSTGQERLFGMKDYMQFRFAMGAPDKEQRFISEVRKVSDRKESKFPTMFAWHGSPIYNWHMIIREGLHFKNADHGRAYGDGVYHAKEASTSTGYSGMAAYGYGGQANTQGRWANSLLNVNSALALNEIVNAPDEFQSSNPFYVVQHIDWIQTRYLFVSCVPPDRSTISIGQEKKPSNAYSQDPQRTPMGLGSAIVIPASAIRSRLPEASDDGARTARVKSPSKRLKGSGGFDNPIAIEDSDGDSVATDAEDLEILFEEAEPEPEVLVGSVVQPKAAVGTPTDFVPRLLDWSTLPIMPQPAYADSGATKRLMKELNSLQKVQQSTPDLGWYIDVEKIDNPYQWIVELHSFHVIDPTLKMINDMKKQDVKSIVLEIQFQEDFPFSPPYVRVIRPRFLSLGQGGGGHIVLGGAMCMELLTNTGWSSVSSMESVLMQIRLAIASDPPARLDMSSGRSGHGQADYGVTEGADGYIRACNAHGWKIPPGFKEMAYGIRDAGSAPP